MTRGEANNYYPHLMASGLGISGDSTGATPLNFVEGALLSTHCPVFAIVKYNSGDLTGCVIEILSDTNSMKSSIGLSDIDASYTNNMVTLDDKPSSGSAVTHMSVDVTSTGVLGCLFDVYIYGIEFKST